MNSRPKYHVTDEISNPSYLDYFHYFFSWNKPDRVIARATKDDPTVLGYASIHEAKNYLKISQIEVEPRRAGIGRAILMHCVDKCIESQKTLCFEIYYVTGSNEQWKNSTDIPMLFFKTVLGDEIVERPYCRTEEPVDRFGTITRNVYFNISADYLRKRFRSYEKDVSNRPDFF